MATFGICERIIRSFLIISSFLFVVLTVFIANAIQLIILPISFFSVRFRHYSNSFMVQSIWKFCNFAFRLTGGKIKVFGAENIKDGESAFIISNHKSMADFFLIHQIAIQKNMIGYCRYFAKDSVKWIPFFGWGIWLMNMIMLRRDWSEDHQRIYQSFKFYTKHKLPLWLISYSEGSRLSPKKIKESQDYSNKTGKPVLDHVLLPRTRGFVVSIKELRNHITALYDITLIFSRKNPDTVPSLFDYFSANLSNYDLEIYIKRFPIEDLPFMDSELSGFLHQRFQEKDKFIEKILANQ
jgi:1-acyl-sn-glycerol-3-phosphate acyltransferase